LLLVNSNNITETFITQKDIDNIKNYQGKVTDTYDTIDEPISDSLIPSNPNDKIELSDYDVIEIYKNICLRPPTIQELKKYVYYTKEELKEFLYNSPEYDKLIKTQNNDVNNGIEGAIAKKNLINRIITIYSTVYKEELPIKMMTPLRDCFIHLQLNEFLFSAMLESYNYKKFEVDVLSTYVLTKKVLLKLFNKHFNVLELKLIAQQKINDTNNQSNKIKKEIESIKTDLLSVSASSNNNIVKTLIGTVKLNYPTVYNELLKTTIKNGGTEKTMEENTDIKTLNSYLNSIERYQNYEEDEINNVNNFDEEPSMISQQGDYYDNEIEPPRRQQKNTYYDEDEQEPPRRQQNNYNDEIEPPRRQQNNYNDEIEPPRRQQNNYNDEDEATDQFKNYEDFKTIENLELNKKTKDKIKDLDNDAELYVRVYKPIVHNNSYVLPSGYKPPICTSIGQAPLTQPTFTQSKLLFQGTDLNTAFNDTQVGSIMPKFIYKEYTDVKVN
jgi:hypothetical protein